MGVHMWVYICGYTYVGVHTHIYIDPVNKCGCTYVGVTGSSEVAVELEMSPLFLNIYTHMNIDIYVCTCKYTHL